MPVTCKKIDDSYRLVDPDGSVSSPAKHVTLESCQKQAAAINANQSTKDSFAVVYIAPGLDSWELSSTDKLTFEKELIYEGEFVKESEGLEFEVDRRLLSHWHFNIGEMLKNGIEIPVPVEHTTNPEKRRGSIVGSMVKADKKGRYALFGKIKFANEEAAKLADSANVSVYAVPEFIDGKGNTYKQAIRHVALTDYPVVPDLEGFNAIAASFGDLKMSSSVLLPIAQRMGIERADEMNDTGLSAAILDIFDTMKNTLKEKEKPVDETETPPEEKPEGEEETEEEKKKKEQMNTLLGSPMAASMMRIQKEARKGKLDNLVLSGNITKASRDKYENIWCSEAKLKLSLTDDNQDEEFEATLEACRQNKVFGTEEERKRALVLSNPQKDEDNPLLMDAERRAKEFQNN